MIFPFPLKFTIPNLVLLTVTLSCLWVVRYRSDLLLPAIMEMLIVFLVHVLRLPPDRGSLLWESMGAFFKGNIYIQRKLEQSVL